MTRAESETPVAARGSSIRERVASFDARQRSWAAAKGAAQRRMAQAAAPRRASTDADGGTTRFFFTRAGVLMCAAVGEMVRPATAQLIADATTGPGKVVAPVSAAVGGQVMRVMKAAAEAPATAEQTEQYGKALRMLRFAHSAAVSSKFVVLTEGLERKFYAPTGIAPTSLAPWAKLFDVKVSAADPAVGMASLLARVWDDDGHADFDRRGDNPWQTILMSEQVVEEVSDRGGPGSTATQFGAAQAIFEGWAAICRTDPLLRHRCEAAGEVVRIRVVGADGAGFLASVSGPVRLREGGCILTSVDHTTAAVNFADLQGFAVREDGLQLVLGKAYKRTAKAGKDVTTVLSNALHDGTELFLSAAPFLSPARRVAARHWSGTRVKPEDRITRDVPLYVAVAGA